jgi:hypothetical protein
MPAPEPFAAAQGGAPAPEPAPAPAAMLGTQGEVLMTKQDQLMPPTMTTAPAASETQVTMQKMMEAQTAPAAPAPPAAPTDGVPSTRRARSAAAAAPAATDEDLATVFNQIDEDGNGFITVAELERWDGAPRPRHLWRTPAAAAPAPSPFVAEDPRGPGGADKAALVRAARAQPSGELDYYDFETAWQVAP